MPPVEKWTCGEVGEWLGRVELGHLAKTLADNGIDGKTLKTLTKTDIREELQIKAFCDRRALWAAIEKVKEQPTAPPARPATPPKTRSPTKTKPASPSPAPTKATPPPTLAKSPKDKPLPVSQPTRKTETTEKVAEATLDLGSTYGPNTSLVARTASKSSVSSCEYCFKVLEPGQGFLELTLPGSDGPVLLHNNPACHEGWVKANAFQCAQCKDLMTGGAITICLPGSSEEVTLHPRCKDAWLEENAKKCHYCKKPLVTSVVEVSGSFGDVEVHDECYDAFVAEMKKRPPRVVEQVVGPVPPSSDKPIITKQKSGSERCGQCSLHLIAGKPCYMIKLPNKANSVYVHEKCRTAYLGANWKKSPANDRMA